MINNRNWELLLIATLKRALDLCPSGPFTQEELDKLDSVKRYGAELRSDIDNILEEYEERQDERIEGSHCSE